MSNPKSIWWKQFIIFMVLVTLVGMMLIIFQMNTMPVTNPSSETGQKL